MIHRLLLSLIICCLMFVPTLSLATNLELTSSDEISAKPPESMAALGDSMSAGLLAKYARQDIFTPLAHLQIMYSSLKMLLTLDKEALSFRQFSWSTGSELNSHYKILKRMNPQMEVRNFSQASAKSENIWKEQIPSLIRWSEKKLNQRLPDYVTLLVGHNDLCGFSLNQMTEVHAFRENIHRSLELLMSESNQTRVLVLPLARLDTVPKNLGNSRHFPIPGFGTCKNVWKTIPLCRTLTQTDSRRAREVFNHRLLDFNHAIKEEVANFREKHGDRIRLAHDIEDYTPQPTDAAIDCFHANRHAQKKISDISWPATWWATSP